MLALKTETNPKTGRKLANAAGIGLAMLMMLGGQIAAAKSASPKMDPRAMQAQAESRPAAMPTHVCQPANGAQILGGFAGADDLIDVNSGEICARR